MPAHLLPAVWGLAFRLFDEDTDKAYRTTSGMAQLMSLAQHAFIKIICDGFPYALVSRTSVRPMLLVVYSSFQKMQLLGVYSIT